MNNGAQAEPERYLGRFAALLAALEAVTGQLFIAIFIARLVGLHLASAGDTGP